jgi:hypothetical protein
MISNDLRIDSFIYIVQQNKDRPPAHCGNISLMLCAKSVIFFPSRFPHAIKNIYY